MSENKHTLQDLQMMQAVPLDIKILMTKRRIRDWVNTYGESGVYVSFSGGKDSTVLLDLVRQDYPSVPAVYVDTGLEYPEIREFVKTFENVVWLRPKMNFKKVIETYGYPIVSKEISQGVFDVRTQARQNKCDIRETLLWDRWFNPESDYAKKYPSYSKYKYDFLNDAPFLISNKCCDVMKKSPSKRYEKETGRKPIIGTMASESRTRTTQWLKDGCNSFDVKRPTSKPMSFWTEQDVLSYVKNKNLPICSVYGNIVEDREGTEEVEGQLTMSDIEGWENMREFDAEKLPLKTTGCDRTGCMFCMFGCTTSHWNKFLTMKKTHPKQYEYIMKSQEDGGLGFKTIIDWLNENGNLNIKY